MEGRGAVAFPMKKKKGFKEHKAYPGIFLYYWWARSRHIVFLHQWLGTAWQLIGATGDHWSTDNVPYKHAGNYRE